MEKWKDVPGYEGFYQVSNKGRVRNKKTNKILKPYLNGAKTKYLRVTLNNNKKCYVHRLIAQAFLRLDKESKLQVDHIDNNSCNNNLNNLQILSQKENLKKQIRYMKKHIKNYSSNKVKNIILGAWVNE